MRPDILRDGFFLFSFFLVVHLVVWRCIRIRREIIWLAYLFLLAALPVLWGVASWRRWSFGESYAVGAVYFSLAVFYLQTYPAIKADVPTFRILLFIQAHPNQDLDMSHLCDEIGGRKDLHSDKIREMQDDALITSRDGNLHLSRAGRLFADFFIGYRRLLGLKTGAG
ncbi:MAG: hypothetical protein HYZ52_04775 [Candidatus Omnitrophica bacterium]|nr:hypothetical protein [Candidatus Omnitrophota bacterium]